MASTPNTATPDEPSPERRKMAAECWKRGNEALPKENWDYAIQMYSQAVKFVPGNLTYRQSLRFTEYKKFDNNGSGAKMASMKLMGTRTSTKRFRMNKDWKSLNDAAEEGLKVNPWDVQLGTDVGDACRELGYQECAIFAYEEVLKVEKANIDVNKSLAGLLEERGEYQRAVECWQRILKAEPTNGEARSKITSLGAKSVLDRGGYEGADSTKGVMAAHEVAKRLGKTNQQDGPGVSVEADLQRAIRKEPANKDNYVKLADYYRREGQLDKAEEQLLKALEVASNDLGIRELLEDVQLDLMKKTHEIAKEQFRTNPADQTLKQRAAELGNELLKRQLEILASRVDRYPADMRMKFDLASCYMKVQKWQQAIPLFQQSRGDPRLKGEALVKLGKCFCYDKKMALGIRQFEAAMPEVKFEDQPDLYKELHYSAGIVYQELKNLKAAEDEYQKVLEVDYSYKDAVDRLNKLQGDTEGGSVPDV
ncbi:MAG: tetratricopeptide repeat protein [Planctomycetes bacterium]|nr:tetratricopeptide repeat protein [Planctomycetota bacterium]